jgi:hypothetical protein
MWLSRPVEFPFIAVATHDEALSSKPLISLGSLDFWRISRRWHVCCGYKGPLAEGRVTRTGLRMTLTCRKEGLSASSYLSDAWVLGWCGPEFQQADDQSYAISVRAAVEYTAAFVVRKEAE